MNTETLRLLPKLHKALLIYFFHDQCAPCAILRPKVTALIKESFPEIELVFVDGRANPDLPASVGVFAFPTLLLYFEGSETGRWSKYVSIAQLESSISRPYTLLFD
jgi:thioredoxin-like negative regulator of GroEL